MGRKRDNQQFRDACNHLEMTPEDRNRFSDYIHDLKECGEKGTANSRGDFTWDELIRHGRDFLEMEAE